MANNSYDLAKINDRIQYFQDDILKVSANRFAKEVGIAYGTLRNLYAEDKKPRKGTLTKILEAYDGFINPAWLQSGKGRPTLSATQEHPGFQLMTSEENWPKVGRQVRKLIKMSEKSAEQIAEASDYSMYRLNKTLAGKQAPTPQFMSILLSELGVTVDQLAQQAGIAVPQSKEKAAKVSSAESEASEVEAKETVSPQPVAAQQAREAEQSTPAAQPQSQAEQQQQQQLAVNQPQAYPVQQPFPSVGSDSVQELRMKIDFLTNRINYLEERLSRLAR